MNGKRDISKFEGLATFAKGSTIRWGKDDDGEKDYASYGFTTYNGKAKIPRYVQLDSTYVPGELPELRKLLKAGKDFRITGYKNNVKAGYAKLTCVGKGDFEGKLVIGFMINPPKVKNLAVKQTGKSKLLVSWNGKPLKKAGVSQMKLWVRYYDKNGKVIAEDIRSVKDVGKSKIALNTKKVVTKKKVAKVAVKAVPKKKVVAPSYERAKHTSWLKAPKPYTWSKKAKVSVVTASR
jgi:hypothetical protein